MKRFSAEDAFHAPIFNVPANLCCPLCRNPPRQVSYLQLLVSNVLSTKPARLTAYYDINPESITAVHISIFRSLQPAVNVYPSVGADSECLPISLLREAVLREVFQRDVIGSDFVEDCIKCVSATVRLALPTAIHLAFKSESITYVTSLFVSERKLVTEMWIFRQFVCCLLFWWIISFFD